MKVLSIVGARPQFVKLAPVDRALRQQGHEHLIVHSGQHYDRLMSQAFFDDLAIAPPITNLGIGSGSHAAQTAGILTALDPVLQEHRPDWTLVYGDTNTTLGGALAASQRQLPLAHLEAGLRSFDRGMPEERNRVMTDHICDLLLAPTAAAVAQSGHRGTAGACRASRRCHGGRSGGHAGPGRGSARALLADLPARRALSPGDRASPGNHGRSSPAGRHAKGPCRMPTCRFDCSPIQGSGTALSRLGIPLTSGALQAGEPLPYPSMIAAMAAARGLITDSGGLQKEALLLGVPCTTLRSRTEWPETLQDGWNVLVSDPQDLVSAVSRPRPAGSAAKALRRRQRRRSASPRNSAHGARKADPVTTLLCLGAGKCHPGGGRARGEQKTHRSCNLHVSPSPIVNASRIFKQTLSVARSGLFSSVVICGTARAGLPRQEDLPHGRRIDRVGATVHDRRPSVVGRILEQLSWSRAVFRRYSQSDICVINAHSVAVLPVCYLLSRRLRAKLIYDTHELETETSTSRGMQRWIFKVIERSLISKMRCRLRCKSVDCRLVSAAIPRRPAGGSQEHL